jgi:glucose-1-phosphatase
MLCHFIATGLSRQLRFFPIRKDAKGRKDRSSASSDKAGAAACFYCLLFTTDYLPTKDPQVIRTFLFDMGNVLVHFCHDRMCRQIGALCGQSGADIRKLLIDSGLQWDFERGRLTEEQFHRTFQQIVQRELVLADLVRAGSDIFELNTSIVPILDELKARGHRLVLLSNTSVSHFQFVQQSFDVLQRFDAFTLSFEVGAIKPEPAIFEAALKAIDCAPEECFYTDDVADYIRAARNYGLQAEVFTDSAHLLQQLEHRGISLSQSRHERFSA